MDKVIRDKYTAVIGLEVHAQLLTESKIFSSDSTAFGRLPNTNISVVTLGHPGTLPKLNKKALEFAIKMGIACNCSITRKNFFDRKNYFYPDLPKGYQITQDKSPICKGGKVRVKNKDGEERDIRLNRIHMEEDAGKSIHQAGETDTLIDLNRAGVPLIEIVSEPDIRTSEEASSFLSEIRKLVRYLEICDGNMDEGSLRCDANISVMLKDAKEYGKKIEVKNMNSIRNVHRAIDYEIDRQINEIEKGAVLFSETRTFDANNGTTSSMRTKEDLNDYRYFPEPDLCPLEVSEEWLQSIKSSMPSLPNELYEKLLEKYKIPAYDASFLTDSRETAFYFEDLCAKTANFKAASNWIMGPIKSFLNDNGMDIKEFPLDTSRLAKVIDMIDQGKISYTAACQVLLPELLKNKEKAPEAIAADLNLLLESNIDSLNLVIKEVLERYPDKVSDYKKGKKGLLGMFVGEVMKKSKGKADPKKTNELLRKHLD
ncbi:MAG: Asp-tRNA(Asn)/Glu-tRNA(Gln) amidotransferase subunit GatB [Bacteroidota bacterium]|nr:Asp-tRNA(Asn)/Glu-tRNA(Gln) amidotransferase subunit GatB [Bacteroidota bacterium]